MIANPRSELLREPNLLVPGKKPVGQVKIDWDHPLTRDLNAYFLTYPTPIDLVTGHLGTVTGGELGGSIDGFAFKTTQGTTGKITFPYHENYSFSNLTGFTYTGKIFQLSDPTASVAPFTPQRTSSVGPGENYFTIFANNTARFWWRDSVNINTSDFFSAWPTDSNIPVNYALTFLDGTGFILYVNENSTAGSAGTEICTENNSTDFTLSNAGTDQSISPNAHNYYVAFWKRTLSVSEKDSMFNDPYQFLIPA